MSIGAANHVAWWQYDADQDVLYIYQREREPSYVEEVEGVEGLHVRKSIATDQVIGVVVLYFSSQCRADLERHMPFSFDFGQIGLDGAAG